MSGRGMSAAMLAEIKKQSVNCCYLVKAEPDHADYTFTDYGRSITWGGDDYVRTFGLLGFTEIIENSQLTVESCTVNLMGVDKNEALAAILVDDFLNRPCSIWLAFLDTSDAVIADPLLLIKGFMDSPSYSEDPESGTAAIGLSVTNNFRDLDRARGRHTNDKEQQFIFSGDVFCQFNSEIPKLIDWGRS